MNIDKLNKQQKDYLLQLLKSKQQEKPKPPTERESLTKMAEGKDMGLQDSLNVMSQYPEMTPKNLLKQESQQTDQQKIKRYEELIKDRALSKALRNQDPSQLNAVDMIRYNELQEIITGFSGGNKKSTTPSTTTSGGTTGGGTSGGSTPPPIVKVDPVTRINQNIKNTSRIAIRKWKNTLPLNEANEIERKVKNGEPIMRDGKKVIWTGKDPNLDSSWEIVE